MGDALILGLYRGHGSTDGIFLTRKRLWIQLHCCDFPHSEAQFRCRYLLYLDVQIAISLLEFLPLGVDAANLSMGDTPTSGFFSIYR